jgi:hypothetical protein
MACHCILRGEADYGGKLKRMDEVDDMDLVDSYFSRAYWRNR